MQYTENYNLKKPESTDFYNVEDNKGNMDIIDSLLAQAGNAKIESDECYEIEHYYEFSDGWHRFEEDCTLDFGELPRGNGSMGDFLFLTTTPLYDKFALSVDASKPLLFCIVLVN